MFVNKPGIDQWCDCKEWLVDLKKEKEKKPKHCSLCLTSYSPDHLTKLCTCENVSRLTVSCNDCWGSCIYATRRIRVSLPEWAVWQKPDGELSCTAIWWMFYSLHWTCGDGLKADKTRRWMGSYCIAANLKLHVRSISPRTIGKGVISGYSVYLH